MIIERTMDSHWLSNSYLVADKPGGHAVLIDTGGPTGPILQKVQVLRLTVSHVLCTHHHVDHIVHNADYKSRFGCLICGHRKEREVFGGLDRELEDGDELVTGGLHIRALHVPGHTEGQLAFLVNEERVFTGDTLFRQSVGGTRAPGHATFAELQHSIMDVLMRLPRDTAVHPGHTDPTTIGEEWEQNPFIRAWRGLDASAEERCLAFGLPAALLLRTRDYDGGTKCWVRFDDGNRLDVVPGSRVEVIPR
jgi:glyoxylase-like metal-dependent hydrolase (beta-lactamase superfamily II)